jgi:hypothetical protein
MNPRKKYRSIRKKVKCMKKQLTDKGNITSYVVRGATISCTLGTLKGSLKLPISHGVYFKGKAQLNVADSVPGKNIIGFGCCKKSSPPPPCTPAIYSKWINHMDTNLTIDNEKALLKDANVICCLGGIISIDKDGQE